MNNRVYRANPGSVFTHEQAQRWGEVIQELSDKFGGISPATLVEHSRGTSLEEFVFSDSEEDAARKYRVLQAGYLLRHINVVKYKDDGTEYEVRAFHYVTVTAKKESEPDKLVKVRVFKAIETLVEENDEELVEQILGMFITLRKKYYNYRELDPIFAAIDLVSKDYNLG